MTPTIPVPNGGIPAEPSTTKLTLSTAPELPGVVNYLPNRSSVRLYLPGVEGARDYRVFAVEDGVTVSTIAGNREHVQGATIFCAGLRQRNQCDEGAILPLKYNTVAFDTTTCGPGAPDRRPHVPATLMQTMDVNGIGPNTTLVVEAIDRQCPFPGLFATSHKEISISASDIGPLMVQAVVNGKPYTLQRYNTKFPVVTQAEIRAKYGSMIYNGQGWNMPTLDPASPNFPESPWIRIGHPAPADDPVVLGRAVVKVSPTGTATLPPGFTDKDYFDDFEDVNDQPKLLRDTDYTEKFIGAPTNVYTTKKWVLYDVANEFSDFFIERGELNMVFGDRAQGSMTLQAMYPKRPVRLPEAPDQYLHVTYQVQRNETNRRYENLVLCGADQLGQTYDGETPKAAPLPRPNFMNEGDTTRTSVLGHNCLYLIPRGPGYQGVGGGDIKSHPDTSLRITVVGTHPAPNSGAYDGMRIGPFAKVFGPNQDGAHPKLWVRQMDAAGKVSGPWLDDQMHVWQKSRFDVFIRRDRVAIFVEGEQRICQDLSAKPLTMAEGALGFWHILYHSSAEYIEVRRGLAGDNPSTGQHHIMHNTPFADQRSWDNVGFREDVAPPPNFDPARCFKGM